MASMRAAVRQRKCAAGSPNARQPNLNCREGMWLLIAAVRCRSETAWHVSFRRRCTSGVTLGCVM